MEILIWFKYTGLSKYKKHSAYVNDIYIIFQNALYSPTTANQQSSGISVLYILYITFTYHPKYACD